MFVTLQKNKLKCIKYIRNEICRNKKGIFKKEGKREIKKKMKIIRKCFKKMKHMNKVKARSQYRLE